jgi:hypothetical protein
MKFKPTNIRLIYYTLIFIFSVSCFSSNANTELTTTTESLLPYTIIDFPCSSSINKLIIEGTHIVVHFRSSNTGYIYRLNTTTKSFEETVRSYADCASGLSAGGWIDNYANGLISKEPNWKSIKLNLNYCLDFYC